MKVNDEVSVCAGTLCASVLGWRVLELESSDEETRVVVTLITEGFQKLAKTQKELCCLMREADSELNSGC